MAEAYGTAESFWNMNGDRETAKQLLNQITPKQHAVMERVLALQTSKEIARSLGISPSTVDQRIAAVRDKLGAHDRAAAARAYSTLARLCEETTYGFSRIDTSPPKLEEQLQELPEQPHFELHDSGMWSWDDPAGQSAILKAVDRRFGKLGRIGLVVLTAVGLAIVMIAGVAMAQALESLV